MRDDCDLSRFAESVSLAVQRTHHAYQLDGSLGHSNLITSNFLSIASLTSRTDGFSLTLFWLVCNSIKTVFLEINTFSFSWEVSNERRKKKRSKRRLIARFALIAHVKVKFRLFSPDKVENFIDALSSPFKTQLWRLKYPIHNTTTMQLDMVHYLTSMASIQRVESQLKNFFLCLRERLLDLERKSSAMLRVRVRLNSIITIILWCFLCVS